MGSKLEVQTYEKREKPQAGRVMFSGKWMMCHRPGGASPLLGPPRPESPGGWRPLEVGVPRGWPTQPLWAAVFCACSFTGGPRYPGFDGVVCCTHRLLIGQNRQFLNISQCIWQTTLSVLGCMAWRGLANAFLSQTLPKGGHKARIAVPETNYFLPEFLPVACLCRLIQISCSCRSLSHL